MDDLENLIFRCVERVLAGRYHKRYGTVTSWDPKTHMAKVMLQPHGVESGWLPAHTMAAGGGYGHMTGLMEGEQVEVTYQEGEFEAGAITARVHSTPDAPPELQSGEQLMLTPFKNFVKLDKNGAVTITDKSGKASIVLDGSGNITIKAATLTHDTTGKHAINGSPVDING